MATTLTVEGMSCDGCEEIVENSIEEVDGVDSVDADRESGSVTVEGGAAREDLVQAIEFAGYETPETEPTDEEDPADAEE